MPLEKVAETSDVQPGQLKLVRVDGKELCLANVDGEYFAFANDCPHAGLPLNDGWLEGDNLECAYHGSKFNVRTGEVTEPPADEALKTYAVRVEGEDILVGSE